MCVPLSLKHTCVAKNKDKKCWPKSNTACTHGVHKKHTRRLLQHIDTPDVSARILTPKYAV